LGTVKYIFIFLVFGLFGFQPEQDYETISWRADHRLSWEDFKGDIPSSAHAAATTASGITYRFSTTGTRDHINVDFQIETHFYPNQSWYQPALCDEIILSHEQLHFDISELFARKLRKELNETSYTHKNVKAKVRSIYRKNNEALSDFQNKYDDETNFSRNREQQLLWNKKIAAALKNR